MSAARNHPSHALALGVGLQSPCAGLVRGLFRIRELEKGEFDLAVALVLVARLSGDPDRAGLGLGGVEEVDADRRQVPVLEGEPVRAGGERAGRRREFHSNDARAAAKFRRRGTVARGQIQFDVAPVQPEGQVALQRFGVRRGLVRRDRAVAVAVDQGDDRLGDGHAGREVDLQPDVAGLDRHERRLQILVETMG